MHRIPEGYGRPIKTKPCKTPPNVLVHYSSIMDGQLIENSQKSHNLIFLIQQSHTYPKTPQKGIKGNLSALENCRYNFPPGFHHWWTFDCSKIRGQKLCSSFQIKQVATDIELWAAEKKGEDRSYLTVAENWNQGAAHLHGYAHKSFPWLNKCDLLKEKITHVRIPIWTRNELFAGFYC